MNRAHRNGILLIVCAALLWSSGGIGIKAISDPPLKVTFYRSLFAIFALGLAYRGKVVRRQWTSTPVFFFAVISYAACLASFVTATKWTTAANAIFLQYAGVVWVMLLAPIVVKEPLRSRDAIAITVALGGMALFFVGKLDTKGSAGNAMALVASVFFAALVLSLRRERDAGAAAITWGNLLACVALFPIVANDLSLSLRSFTVLALLGVFQIALPYLLFVRGLQAVTATEASLTGMIEPVANPIWVFLALGERPSSYAIGGALIVLGAIAWRTIAGEKAIVAAGVEG